MCARCHIKRTYLIQFAFRHRIIKIINGKTARLRTQRCHHHRDAQSKLQKLHFLCFVSINAKITQRLDNFRIVTRPWCIVAHQSRVHKKAHNSAVLNDVSIIYPILGAEKLFTNTHSCHTINTRGSVSIDDRNNCRMSAAAPSHLYYTWWRLNGLMDRCH